MINAPGVIKLLSLADLGGLADLAEGEGLSFDVLEVDMEKTKDLLKLNEILALGPSMSVLIEGYQDDRGLTSLKGTLVPAKTLNKMISKIPVIGNIVIPKSVTQSRIVENGLIYDFQLTGEEMDAINKLGDSKAKRYLNPGFHPEGRKVFPDA